MMTKKQETVKRNIFKLQENIKNFLTISTEKMRTLSILCHSFGEFESLFLLQQAWCNDCKLGTFKSVLKLRQKQNKVGNFFIIHARFLVAFF
jgi:hypothetical protein